MKTTFILLLFSSLFTVTIRAQTIQVSLMYGKNFPSFRSELKTYSHYHQVYQNYTHTIDKVNTFQYSLGEGQSFTLGLGYKINRFFTIGAEFMYLKGKATKFKWVDNYDSQVNPSLLMHFTFNNDRSGKTLAFSPVVQFYPFRWKANPFIKASVLFSRHTINEDHYLGLLNTIPTYVGYERINYNLKFDPVYNISIKAGFGMDLPLSVKHHFFVLLELNKSMDYPERAHITTYYVNDEDLLNLLTVKEREVVFTDDPQTNTPDNEPSQIKTEKVSFGYISLNAGLKISLNPHSKKK